MRSQYMPLKLIYPHSRKFYVDFIETMIFFVYLNTKYSSTPFTIYCCDICYEEHVHIEFHVFEMAFITTELFSIVNATTEFLF